MRRPEVGIGMIGYGAMGKAHSYAHTIAPLIRDLPVRPRLRIISGRNEPAVAAAADSFGFDEWTTDWRQVIARPDVDIVDVCTPPGTHAWIIEAAASAGKAVICEKPLAATLDDAMTAVAAVHSAGVPNAVGFNYRHLPAVSLMRQLIGRGAVGEVLLWRGRWLSDEFLDPRIPFDWRFDRALGATTIADLGCHLIDLAGWMVAPVREVCGQSATFTPTRADPSGETAAVSVDDASGALLSFDTGARGTLEVARTCARRPCDFTVEVNGTLGTLIFDYSQLNELRFGHVDDDDRFYGMRTIRAEHPSHPYAKDWWAIGQGVGYGSSFVNFFADLLALWPDGPWLPDLSVGLDVQRVCDAIERSVTERRWVSVPV